MGKDTCADTVEYRRIGVIRQAKSVRHNFHSSYHKRMSKICRHKRIFVAKSLAKELDVQRNKIESARVRGELAQPPLNEASEKLAAIHCRIRAKSAKGTLLHPGLAAHAHLSPASVEASLSSSRAGV